jgi:hypothetical protein
MNTKIIKTTSKQRNKEDPQFSEFYNKYAPVIFGLILKVVGDKTIAEKVFLQVFNDAFVHENMDAPKLVSKFTAVANHARKKSLDAKRAIKLFQACNEGRPINVPK